MTPRTWRQATVAAARLEADRSDLIPIGLIGFLVRGGLLLFLVPILVLPTPIGIANFIGASAITASGPAPYFVNMLVVLGVIVFVTLIATTVIGTVTDLWLLRSVMAASDGVERRVGASLVARASVIRIVALVPFALAAGFGIASLGMAVYNQLVTPTDTATPFALRVLREAGNAVVLVGIAWLIGETIGGLAVRHLAIENGGILRSLGRGIADLGRRPITTLATVALSVLVIVLAVAPALLITIVLWGQLPAVLEGVTSARGFLGALLVTAIFVGVWAGGLALAALAATWRSVLWDLEVLRTAARPAPAPGPSTVDWASPGQLRPNVELAFEAVDVPSGSADLSHTVESRSS